MGAPWTRVERGDHTLVDREIDWAIKHRLVERYRRKHRMDLSSPVTRTLNVATKGR